jgi:hypothetical protein
VPEAHGERVLELTAQAALELGAGELVADGDDRGIGVERDRLAGAYPGLLVGLELVDDVLPGGSEVGVVVHRKVPLSLRRGTSRVPLLDLRVSRSAPARVGLWIHRFVHTL